MNAKTSSDNLLQSQSKCSLDQVALLAHTYRHAFSVSAIKHIVGLFSSSHTFCYVLQTRFAIQPRDKKEIRSLSVLPTDSIK